MPESRANGIKVLWGALALLLSSATVAADWVFSPRASLGEVWTDNLRFAGKGLEESEWITELKPGFAVSTDGPQIEAQLDYDLQALLYADNDDLNDVYHQARGVAELTLLPQSVFFDTMIRYDQQVIDPRELVDYSNLFDTGNRTDVFVYSGSPYHVARWGSWGESLVRYQYQGVNYSNTDGERDLEDLDSQAIFASLGSPRERAGVSWRVAGTRLVTRFDESPNFEFAQVESDIGLPVGSYTRATFRIGRESDIGVNQSDGGLDETFWYVGFDWEPNSAHRFSAQVGQRYYGDAWEVHWTRSGSRGELGLSYTEDPTTVGGVLGDGAFFDPGFEPGGLPGLDARVFLLKSLTARGHYNLAKSTINARIYAHRYVYEVEAGGVERQYGAAIDYGWQLARRTTLGTSVDWSHFDLDTVSYDQASLTVRLRRQLTRLLSGEVGGGHNRVFREGDDIYVNRIFVYLTAQF